MSPEHLIGFEKEEEFNRICSEAYQDCVGLKVRTVERIIAHINPSFTKGLFEIRPCVRKLKYIGCWCNKNECSCGSDEFELGRVYESEDFNGGTYKIKGHEGRIGSAYFRVVSDEFDGKEVTSHSFGFENERLFNVIFVQARKDCPTLMARTVRRIIAQVNPSFVDGLFRISPCVRWLKYIGCGCEEEMCSHGPSFFKVDEIYESIDFNGATYGIKGYEGRLGLAYFEWIQRV